MQRVTTNDNEWQPVTTSDSEWYNEWQRVTTSDNGTVHFKEWMIAIISMTKKDTLLLQRMVGCN